MEHLLTPEDIRVRASAKGLSILALCRLAEIDSSTYHRWANGEREPNLKIYRKLVELTEPEQAP